jgi:hypothetical protein
MKISGEVGFKRYGKGKLLGKGLLILIKVALPNAIKESIYKTKNLSL